jgi:hypothetical protein
MVTAWGAVAVDLLTGTILRGGDQIGSQDVFVFAQVEGLCCELNRDASF